MIFIETAFLAIVPNGASRLLANSTRTEKASAPNQRAISALLLRKRCVRVGASA
jgi:hypothetical protein